MRRTELRTVFDTNVLVSAVLQFGLPASALDLVLQRHRLLLSDAVFSEYSSVLLRPKLSKYISRELVESILQNIHSRAELVEITMTIQMCRDPDDDKMLELAVNGRAACIVSGDKDLLSIGKVQGIPILSVAEFVIHAATTG